MAAEVVSGRAQLEKSDLLQQDVVRDDLQTQSRNRLQTQIHTAVNDLYLPAHSEQDEHRFTPKTPAAAVLVRQSGGCQDLITTNSNIQASVWCSS